MEKEGTMRHHFLKKLTAAACALALSLTLAPAALAADSPAVSSNYLGSQYVNGSKPVFSHLYENPQGGLTRVEYLSARTSIGSVVVEDYDDSFTLLSSRRITPELPLWGGFFAGEQYNFLIYGQNNMSESDGVEVIRVVKYDKNWNRLGQTSVYGANTQKPFQAGSLRCAEAGGVLYIQTCHTKYKSGDGLNHQSNMRIVVRERDMTATEVDIFTGYVSHSFNQYILVDHEGNLVTADHGDASPRAIILYKIFDKAGSEQIQSEPLKYGYAQTDRFPGEDGFNYTGATLGGLAETSSGYLMSYTFNGGVGSYPRNQAYLAYVPKSGFAQAGTDAKNIPQITQVTHYDSANRGNPNSVKLVPTSLDGGYLLWNRYYGDGMDLSYTTYSADGSIGTVQTVAGATVSDCQPIVYNGKVVWYTTRNTAPVFYTLDGSGLKAVKANAGAFSDVPASHWAYSAIRQAVKDGITSGYADGTFRPGSQVTNAHFCAFAARAFYSAESSAAASGAWYQPYTDTLMKHGILQGTAAGGDLSANIDKPISRYDMAQVMYNILVDRGAAMPSEDALAAVQPNISDWGTVPETYRTAVSVCYALGLLQGQTDGSFGGKQAMNRAQACVVLSRLQAAF